MVDLSVSINSHGFVGIEPEQKIQGNKEQTAAIYNATSPSSVASDTTPLSVLAAQATFLLVDDINVRLQEKSHNLSFSVDQDSGQNIVKVLDSENGELIRQIPSEELLVLRKKMDDLNGIIFDKEV